MRSIILCLFLASASRGGVEFDPIALAMDALTAQGIPPPAGYDVRPARPGELKGTEIAHTFPDEGAIAVDLRSIGLNANCSQELIDLVAAVLVHEYQHCGGDGNNSQCDHQGVYGQGLDFLCELIEQRESEGECTDGLCALNRLWTDRYNTIPCDPSPPKRFPCNACG